MPIDNLIPNLKQKPVPTEKYLAIEIGSETVKAAVWEIVANKPNVIQTGSIEEVNLDDEDGLIRAIDTTVSKAQESVDPEPKEVIFSLPENWVNGGSVAGEKKPFLKKLSKKLDLKPLGFVVTVEALVSYLKHQHGTPPTVILLGLTETEVVVTVVKNGEAVGNQTVGRSDDLSADVQEGLARFNDLDSLPPSMILYNGHTDLENEKQVLISYDWQENLSFLHIPKIESLNPDETVKAVAVAGGFEVVASKISQSATAAPAQSRPTASVQANDTKVKMAESSDKDEPIPDLSQQFGFSSVDVISQSKAAKTAASAPAKKEEAGFVVHDLQSPGQAEGSEVVEPVAEAIEEDDAPLPGRGQSRRRLNKIHFPNLGFSFKGKPRLPLLLLIGGLILLALAAGGVFAYWNLPKAAVVVYLEPKVIDSELAFTLDPSIEEADLSTATLPGKTMDAAATGTKEAEVTGEKLVGDQATGTVTIYNRTDSVKTFSAGTSITGPDGLKYTVDEAVTIASASTKENPDLSITTEPSQADANVTAASIGAQYNLGTGTEFKVSNFDSSSFLAKAKSDLVGGTSRQITAVSQKDQDKLLEALKEELQTKALEQADQTAVGNSIAAVVIPEEKEQLESNFSAKIGEEANTLRLEATLTLKTMTYKKSDLSLLIENEVKDSISDNYQLQKNASEIEVVDTVLNEDGSLTIKAVIKAKVTPTITAEDIVNNIKGRYPQVTQDYFNNLPSFSKVEIDITPKLPARLATFPKKADNITVEFKTKE